jgi:hypothetical protein
LFEELETMNEEELKNYKAPSLKTKDELDKLIETLSRRIQTYGTCVYAASIVLQATAHYMDHILGLTGFQASCVDIDFVSKRRLLKHGFRIIDYEKLLYPQFYNSNSYFTLSAERLLYDNIHILAIEANRLLIEQESNNVPSATNDVINHWKFIVKKGIETNDVILIKKLTADRL